MIKEIRMALKYKTILPVAIQTVEEVRKAVDSSGAGGRSLTKRERSKLMKQFWKIVTEIQKLNGNGKAPAK